VQPALGAFPEIIKQTGGGVVYSPNTADAMAEKWMEVLSNPQKILEMGKKGKESVKEKYAIHEISKGVLEIYKSVL